MIYVVQPGDTLGDISVRSGVPVDVIQYLNQIPNSNEIIPGQALLLAFPQPGELSIQAGGYAYPFISPWVLNETLPWINLLSVFTYGFTEDGMLLPPALNDGWMVDRARDFGVTAALVLAPMDRMEQFSNVLLSRLLENEAAQDRLLEELAETMEEKGFGELNIDFEFVPAQYRQDLTAFVRKATERLPWPVTICLAPKTSRQQRGLLYEGKDYAALGEVADRLLLMTYEWGYKYGPPLAVAPIDQVRRVVEYAVTEIPPEKLLLGMANYGYDWPLPYVREQTVARTIGSLEAVSIARRVGADILFDRQSMSPWFRYRKDGILHEVWFEDVRSWQAKFDLVKEFGLAGVGIWTVMNLNRPGLALLTENFRQNGMGVV